MIYFFSLTIIINGLFYMFNSNTFITCEKVVDPDAVEITRNKPHSLKWSPLIGIAVMGVGGIMPSPKTSPRYTAPARSATPQHCTGESPAGIFHCPSLRHKLPRWHG